ncbi:VOC family protein [Vibrio sp. S4M6]|uniref:VOC family protein n=1 Tax=Vibrio sinus TaxID=2946865 RepID=UPI00202A1ADF|nr:VOC family protein [Vibrio sinus]MCL9781839.1 VOC family protein [Vibrio sinus]
MLTSLSDLELLPEQLKSKFPMFMEQILQLGALLKVDLTQYQADHIAFRVNDENLAMQAKEAWSKEANVISEATINGRPIYVLQFAEPMIFGSWQIECLELPFPAVNNKVHPVQSWEHVEFVVPSEANSAQEYLQDVTSKWPDFAAQFPYLENLGVKIKLSSPKGEGERLNNPTISFKWENICIKFHPHSIKKIVESERQ